MGHKKSKLTLWRWENSNEVINLGKLNEQIDWELLVIAMLLLEQKSETIVTE